MRRLLVLIPCVALALGAVQAQDRAERRDAAALELAQGKAIYAHWCAPCHAADPGLAGTRALQEKYHGRVPAALEDRTDLSPVAIEVFVRNGVAWMPPFRPTEISDADLAELSAYLSAPLENRGAHVPLLVDEMLSKGSGK